MSDTLMSIIGIFLAIVIMFVFPLMELAGKGDEVSQTVVEVAVSDFVNTVATTGQITWSDYNKLLQKLYSTGNSFDIQIEAQILDDNPRRATTTASSDVLGEYRYYSVYTNTILSELEKSENSKYQLKNDDYIIVSVKNTNTTMGTQLKNLLYNLIGKDTYTIGTSSSALVLNTGMDEEKEEKTMQKPNDMKYPDKKIYISTNGTNWSQKWSENLKIVLNNLSTPQAVRIIMNGSTYNVGQDIPSYLVYFDNTKGNYVLDLKILIELLDITLENWMNTIGDIRVQYT